MNNNDDVFLKQMKGVSPIKKNNKIKKEEPKTHYKSEKKNIVKQKKVITPTVTATIKKSEFFYWIFRINIFLERGTHQLPQILPMDSFLSKTLAL